ncbi:MAG: hypothetical protein C4K47_00040 [Candidatus Thorarchaeota archaeon]|nr:MAG: hypothetical protein C4K47_00040 [Candidatus Thorarchaeota archaeon]
MGRSWLNMGTYVENIHFPLGASEAIRRVNKWHESEGKDFKVLEKSENHIEIRHKTLHIIITLIPDHLRIEAWVGGITKYSIAPDVIVGALARRQGWKEYQTLKQVLISGIEPRSLG